MTLRQIADRLWEHLQRMERADDERRAESMRLKVRHASTYWNSSAIIAGRFIDVRYISYQQEDRLTKDDALAYLAWLDAGNSGQYNQFTHQKGKANG